MKTAEQQRARELRTQGWSVREIERSLGVREPLKKEQREAIPAD